MSCIEKGEPIRGVVHSTDASSGVAIVLRDLGNTGSGTRTLTATERLWITHVTIVTAVGGDCRVFVGADSTPANGEDVVRGTFVANGGYSDEVEFTGEEGHTPFVIAPAGVVDVFLHGFIVNANTAGQRPSWKESQVPGS